MRHLFELDGVLHQLRLVRQDRVWRAWTDEGCIAFGLEVQGADRCLLTLDGETEVVAAIVDGDTVHVQLDGRAFVLRYRDPVDFHAAATEAGGHDVARAPMPGGVLSVQVAAGAHVRAGDTLLTIESMKMETAIKASRDGTVETVHVAAGQMFDRDAALITLLRDEA